MISTILRGLGKFQFLDNVEVKSNECSGKCDFPTERHVFWLSHEGCRHVSKDVNADNGEISKDLEEIEKSHYNEADRLGMKKKIGEMKTKWK